MTQQVTSITATEILDSRGYPTLAVEVEFLGGAKGYSEVPSGHSTGEFEAVELRDGDSRRYRGKGVLTAVAHVSVNIAEALIGCRFDSQQELDQALINLDNTANKWRLGANAMLGVSVAAARAFAHSRHQSLFEFLSIQSEYSIPLPMVSLISGGVHADNCLDIEEFMIVPHGATTFRDAVQMSAEVFHVLGILLRDDGYQTGVGDEGGYAPRLESMELAFDFVMRAIEKAGFIPGEDISLALDIAASELVEFDGDDPFYRFSRSSGMRYSTEQLIEIYEEWMRYYPIVSIEDGLSENDWEGWQELTRRLGSKCQLVGDDVFVTNVSRIAQGIETGVANAVLIKPNQIGTLSETLEAIQLANRANYRTILGHRAGETCDATIAELAVAIGADQIKAGSICRGERIAKYNKLLRIEAKLGNRCRLSRL